MELTMNEDFEKLNKLDQVDLKIKKEITLLQMLKSSQGLSKLNILLHTEVRKNYGHYFIMKIT